MNKLATLLAAGAGILYIGALSCDNGAPSPAKTDSANVVQAPVTSLSPILPYDKTIGENDSVLETTIRHDFDLFSWQSFVAISWPVTPGQVIGQFGDNPTVWESWKENYEVFLEDGSKPAPWDAAAHGEKKLFQVGKTPTVLTDISQPFLTGPLIDQNGQYLRFEIVMNREMFDYIDANTLYNYEGQQAFKDTIIFPEGSIPAAKHGAIMVKASWKLLGAGDDTARFHKAKAMIVVKALPDQNIRDTSFEATVGLVGLHIGTKTKTSPQWIWSTFEQVDNAPSYGSISDVHYNFFNKAAGDKNINNAPAHPWNPNTPGQVPSQIVRLIPIAAGTSSLNDSFRRQLIAINPRSVWQYYELVGTQWPVHPQQSALGDPFPVYMANATLETYIQGRIKNNKVVYTPNVTSSCMGCHLGATTFGGKPSDFTYLLKTANVLKKK